MKLRYRFSIGFLLCFTALMAVTLSHGITSWQLNAARSENSWLKNARITSWPDPSLISVVSLDTPNSGFRPENKTGSWHWKIMTPHSSSLRLRWDALPQTLAVAPMTIDLETENFIEILTGTIELEATIRKIGDHEMCFSFIIAGKQNDFTFKSDSRLFEQHGFINNIAGVRMTETGDPRKPFLLVCARGYAKASVPTHGIRVWLEPTP